MFSHDIDRIKRNSRPIYIDAYNADFYSLWGNTNFKWQIADLCYIRAATCFLHDSELGEEDRRKLLYSYLKNCTAYEKESDPINKSFPILPTDNTVIKRILQNLCFVYNQKASRDFNLPDNQKDELNGILKTCKYDKLIKQIYQSAKLVNECAVRLRQVNGKWILDYLTPDLYRLVKDDYDNLIEIWIPFHTVDKYGSVSNRFHCWNNEYYWQADIDGNSVDFTYKINNGKENKYSKLPNKYGKIPFVFLRFSDNPDIYGGGLWELVKSQLIYNSIQYFKNENLIYGGVGLWILKNFTAEAAKNITLNPGVALVINDKSPEEPSDIERLTGTPIWNEIDIAAETMIKNTMRNLGLPNSMIGNTANLQSGVAMKIDRLELEELRNDDINTLKDFEEELINHIIYVYNVETGRNIAQVELRIDFAETQTFAEPLDELKYTQELYRAGLMTPLNYVIKLTGNDMIKNDNDAINFIKQNLDYVKQTGNNYNANDTGTDIREPDQRTGTAEGIQTPQDE
jgi:hypothetical protein